MVLLILLNVIALFSFLIMIYGFYVEFISRKELTFNFICLSLKAFAIFNILIITISIYFPLKIVEAATYSKYFSAPFLIILCLIVAFLLIVRKKVSCYVYEALIVIGLTAASFRILSSLRWF